MERKTLYKVAAISVLALALFFVIPIWRRKAETSLTEEAQHSIQKPRPGFRFKYDRYCDTLFNSGGWVGIPTVSSCDANTKSVATCGPKHADNWQWSSDALRCGAERLGAPELRAALGGKWVVIAGDSISRYFYAAFLRLLSADITQTVVYGHRDFEYMLPGKIRTTFVWAPYANNLTELFTNWTQLAAAPDAVVLSAGLWHMLHVTDATMYAQELTRMKTAIASFRSSLKVPVTPPMSIFSISEVYPPKLKTEEKRQHLTLANVDSYNKALNGSGILVPEGPLYLIDVHHLTQGCGPSCTHDGLHYSNATYDAAFQIWANNLLSVTKSKDDKV